MRILSPSLLVVAFVLLSGCQSVDVATPASVGAAPRLEVSGRQGWLPGRYVAFGEFRTSEVDKHVDGRVESCPAGCSRLDVGTKHAGDVYSRRFDESFEQATSRLEFSLDGRSGALARVRAVEERSAESREWVTSWFRVPTDVRVERRASSWRVGTVEPVSPATAASWHFVLWSESAGGTGPTDGASVVGWAETDGHDRHVSFVPLPSPFPANAVPAVMATFSPGWAFETEGRTLGAVSLMGPGHVWIHPDATPAERQLVAALSAALLLQPAAVAPEAHAGR
jgi:hypothetical protein